MSLISIFADSKTIPRQACTDPEGSKKIRLLDFKTIDTCRWLGYQPY